MSTGPSPPPPLILASASATRLRLLRAAGLTVEARPARIDEDAIRTALRAEDATPRDIADTLAETKARRIADRAPQALVLGCDQVLVCDNRVWAKPADRAEAASHLRQLSGRTHELLSAVVLYHEGQPQWRHVAVARLTMRNLSDSFIDSYLDAAWPDVADSVGAYRIEERGIRLLDRIEGDHFTILGLPLLPLLLYLGQRGLIPA